MAKRSLASFCRVKTEVESTMLTPYYSLFSEQFQRYLEERQKERKNYQPTTSPMYDSGNKEIHKLFYFFLKAFFRSGIRNP